MPPITADDVLKSIHDLKETMQNELKSVNERVAEAKKQAADDLVAMQAQFRRDFVSPGGPLTMMQGAAATQRGGLFAGQMKLPYMRMITLSAWNPVVLPSDKERLTIVQQLHDALVIRYWAKAFEMGEHASREDILREISQSDDWKMWEMQIVDAGYARANEIMHPGATPGSNFDFTLLSNQMIDLVRVEAVVATQFEEVTLPRAKVDFPALRSDVKSILGGGLSTYAVPATTNANVAGYPQTTMLIKPTTGQIEFNCIHNLGAIPYNDDMLEDSVVPFLPFVYKIGVYGLARGRDAVIINGDKTVPHMDSDVTAAYDIRKGWYGLRKMGENNEADINGPPTSVDVNTLMQKLGKYASNPRQLRLFLNVIDWLRICADPLMSKTAVGIDRQLLEEGVVDTIYGVPVVLTEEIRRDTAVNGQYDGVTTNNTLEILCRVDRFWRGQTRGVRIEQVRTPQALAGWLQLDSREDFQALDKEKADASFASGAAPVAIGVNVSS